MQTRIPAPEAINEAIDRLNDIVAAVGAHRHRGRYSVDQLLELIEGDARDIRKMLEAIIDRAG